MAVERKPVTKKPTWWTGVIIPTWAGCFVSYTVVPMNSLWAWYFFAGWLLMFGFALIFERAPVYGVTSAPQARRLCELYGIQCLAMCFLTVQAGKELVAAAETNGEVSLYSLPSMVLLTNLICTYAFSICAGPARLVNANDNEMFLVPSNAFIVGVMISTLLLLTTY